MHNRSDHFKGLVYGLLSGLFVAGYVLVNRYVYNTYDVEPFYYSVTFAVAGGLFALSALFVRHIKTHDIKVSRTTAWQLPVVGLAGGTAMGLIVLGQNYTSAVNAAIVMTASILTTSLFSWLMLKESFSVRQRVWLAIMFVGLYLGVVGLHIVQFRLGDLIIFAAMVILGFNNTFSKVVMRRHDGNFIADARLTISGILMLLLGLLVAGTDILVTTAGLWPILGGLFFWLCIRTFYACIQHASPNQAIVLNNSSVFFTAVVGVLLLSEAYDWLKFLGSVIVLLSLYFITKK
jgi:drug/metabolite transporter (DMT)-like permease